LQEDLKGYEHDEAMRSFSHWKDHGNGTVTDTRRSLTWIRAPYGMIWEDGRFHGEPTALDWYEASRRFGRGNIVGLTNDRIDPDKLRQHGLVERGYAQGQDLVTFAGSSGWRLPTIGEYLTLEELTGIAQGFIGEDRYYCFFDAVFCRGSRLLMELARRTRFMSATSRSSQKKVLEKTLWHGIAWSYDPIYGAAIDIGSEQRSAFLLVKG
jgi:hypothetical protein